MYLFIYLFITSHWNDLYLINLALWTLQIDIHLTGLIDV